MGVEAWGLRILWRGSRVEASRLGTKRRTVLRTTNPMTLDFSKNSIFENLENRVSKDEATVFSESSQWNAIWALSALSNGTDESRIAFAHEQKRKN